MQPPIHQCSIKALDLWYIGFSPPPPPPKTPFKYQPLQEYFSGLSVSVQKSFLTVTCHSFNFHHWRRSCVVTVERKPGMGQESKGQERVLKAELYQRDNQTHTPSLFLVLGLRPATNKEKNSASECGQSSIQRHQSASRTEDITQTKCFTLF